MLHGAPGSISPLHRLLPWPEKPARKIWGGLLTRRSAHLSGGSVMLTGAIIPLDSCKSVFSACADLNAHGQQLGRLGEHTAKATLVGTGQQGETSQLSL